ncbi:MAG: ogt [Verrucomicrobiales bacterium]|nr:ogt [Verrucomicrobiales bacterium]
MQNKTNRKSSSTEKRAITNSYAVIDSPIGKLMLVADEEWLVGLYFVDCPHVPAMSGNWKRDAQHALLRQAGEQLHEYFAGHRTRFTIPLRSTGTDFQKSIWKQIEQIPYGQTLSYSELATRAGASHAIRAAGTSTGRNPISIIVPCHRVVGKNGGMCGFAGGLDRKALLLKLEGGHRMELEP